MTKLALGVCSVFCALQILASVAFSVASEREYHLLHTYAIGGGDGSGEYWDILPSMTPRGISFYRTTQKSKS